MRLSRKLITDLVVGGTLSILFGGLLFNQILTSNVGNYDSFVEFLGDPGNLLFCLLMSMFIIASWLMAGMNNRTVLFFWAILVVFNSYIYYSVSFYFSDVFKNIYALSCVGLAASIPVVLLIRYRVIITIKVCETVWKAGFFKTSLGRYLSCAGITDFDFDMRLALYAAFTVEFLYSLHMITYGVLNQIPYNSSISGHMLQNDDWQPFDIYFSSLNIVGTVYILIIALHLYRDNKKPDAFGYGMTEADRTNAGLKLLEKSRKRTNK